MIQIRYLQQFEKKETLPLWNEAFPEDRQQFLDYYYKEKTKDNRILAALEGLAGQTKIVSMIHRNPYRLWVNGQLVDSDYVVAVATAADRRHQGFMRKLLAQMAADMYQEGMPFCYLMPADRKIYEPFGFAYIYDQEHWQLKDDGTIPLKKQKVSLAQAEDAAEWMNRWLRKRYEIFTFRNEAYVRRLLLELESEQGWMEFLYDQTENLAGIQCWWGTDKIEQRMLLCEEPYRKTKNSASPAIMARIFHLERCLELLCLSPACPMQEMDLILHVKDSFCPWNQGTFLWKLTKQGSRVFRQKESGSSPQTRNSLLPKYQLNLTIPVLTQWIFGYQDLPKEAVITAPGEPDGWHRQIAAWKHVFLDEIV